MRYLEETFEKEKVSDIYWWIENSRGLIKLGRHIDKTKFKNVYETGCPNLQITKKKAQELCISGEKPVKVKIVKVGGVMKNLRQIGR